MGFDHLVWASRVPVASAGQRAALVSLATYADDDGVCWPSQAALAERAAMSVRTLSSQLNALREAGLASWEARTRRGAKASSRYQLHMTPLDGKTAGQPDRKILPIVDGSQSSPTGIIAGQPDRQISLIDAQILPTVVDALSIGRIDETAGQRARQILRSDKTAGQPDRQNLPVRSAESAYRTIQGTIQKNLKAGGACASEAPAPVAGNCPPQMINGEKAALDDRGLPVVPPLPERSARYCPAHPNDTDAPCRECATARQGYESALKAHREALSARSRAVNARTLVDARKARLEASSGAHRPSEANVAALAEARARLNANRIVMRRIPALPA